MDMLIEWTFMIFVIGQYLNRLVRLPEPKSRLRILLMQ